jgi:CheY-like chemotaxis protein
MQMQRVLLVDDNRASQVLVTKILGRRGHTVTVAGSGREALALHAAEHFDIVLMDINMPEMDGVAATQAIRAIESRTGEHLRIVALTGRAGTEECRRFLQQGMDGCLTKPFLAMALCEAVEVEAPSGASVA